MDLLGIALLVATLLLTRILKEILERTIRIIPQGFHLYSQIFLLCMITLARQTCWSNLFLSWLKFMGYYWYHMLCQFPRQMRTSVSFMTLKSLLRGRFLLERPVEEQRPPSVAMSELNQLSYNSEVKYQLIIRMCYISSKMSNLCL
ncbi:hypothetical protein ES319_D04G111000v1 [Gossypium barbadense]|uniref:Uncharacterized protein n=1 Tax=Gossypium barbadense TaxID=3634 RepID=A0A5J5RYM0_GOSBA|nr:hypothetical protein ES319_D04G111000v1 [Gossypium barbadense]